MFNSKVAETTHKVTGWHLEFVGGTSDKFYKVFAFADGHLVLNFGRNGTSGTFKVEKHEPQEALHIAKRQAYSKSAKGYQMLTEEFVFALDDAAYQRTVRGSWGPVYLNNAFDQARHESAFSTRQRLVTTHYDEFIEETNQVLDAAAKGEDFENLLTRWEKLQENWKELAGKHEHAAASVQMVQQVVMQKMMGG